MPPAFSFMKLSGIFVATTTPFDHAGDVYKLKVEHNVDKWNHTSVGGYAVCADAGEDTLLSADDKALVWELSAKWAAADKILIAGASADSVRETVDLIARAAGLGYKAALVRTPRIDGADVRLYFATVADRSALPVIVQPDDTAQIPQHPNLIAVRMSGAKGLTQPVLGCDAAHLHADLQNGAAGAILSLASAAPYACITIWEAHRTREKEAAEDWQQRIQPAAAAARSIPQLKHAMDLNGYYGGPPRLPLVVATPSVRAGVEQAFDGIKS
ncbi:MAG: dihydrodipicolinate synthase family protein, partial [Bryobacteraceae bacterium]